MSAKGTVSIRALGCPKAIVDAEQLLAVAQDCGYEINLDSDDCDVLIVNTCSFIENARDESFEAIEEALQLKREGKVGRVIVTGCLPQIMINDIQSSYPDVNACLGAGINSALQDVLLGDVSCKLRGEIQSDMSLLPRFRLTLPHVSYLRLAEGCSNRCSYCRIPEIRGNVHSFPINQIIREGEQLVSSGAGELILIAEDTAIVGLDANPRFSLSDVTIALSAIEGLEWLRILYTNPMHITDETIKAFDAPKVLPYFEIPVQHCSNNILKGMGRPMPDTDGICKLIEDIRERFDEPTIRSTVMVGFPGEGEDEFRELDDFVSEVEFDRLGVFAYSPEPCTPAFSLNHAPDDIVAERCEQIIMTQQDVSWKRNSELVGKIVPVIVDCADDAGGVGRTKADAPEIDCQVRIDSKGLTPGEITDVRIIDHDHYDLVGICDAD